MNRFRRSVLFIICSFVVISLTGCSGPAAYKAPISKFQAASSVVISSSRNYILEVNKVARDIYIDECINDKEDIRLDKLYDAQPLSAEGLSLRLRALQELSNYGRLLYDLATGDKPAKLQSQFKNIGTAFKNISNDLPKDAGGSDQEFGKSIGPVSEIAGVIAENIMKEKIQAALSDAIKLAEGPVNKMILTIRDDVTVAYAQKRDFYSQQRVRAVDDYNSALKKGDSGSSLRAKAEKLKAQLDLYEVLVSADPRESFDAMLKANTALVDYAKSSKKPADLEAFAAAMEDFVSSVEVVAGGLKCLR
jgi:hypothetical protein